MERMGTKFLAWEISERKVIERNSFVPFKQLLVSPPYPEVRLWAVWTLSNVCSHDPIYCYMLLDSKIVFILILLISLWPDPGPDNPICRSTWLISKGIIELVEKTLSNVSYVSE